MTISQHENQQNYRAIAKAICYLNENQLEQPSLKVLASVVGMSEFHFQRTFSEWAGVSPKQFLLFLTKENAKKKLREYSVMQSALENGLSGSSRLHDLFITHEGVTPGEYRKWGQDLNIFYGIYSCIFGYCLIASTSRGVCKLAFFDDDIERDFYISELHQEWQNATIQRNNEKTDNCFKSIFLNECSKDKPIHLLLKGTPFKLQVWQALLSLPEGQLATYSHIADAIKNPNAVRAVASAIANNPIAYLIPCHRVIRNTGVLNDYRWGKERKAAMIAREQCLNSLDKGN
jgi:AraC family transcriptional regulator of adaptative response/methylated-DNA-[protein]-cysteine methyltransferase